MLRSSLNLTKMIVISSLIASCSTSSISQQQEPVKAKKAVSKAGPIAKPNVQASPSKVTPQIPAEIEYSSYFERIASPDKDFTEKDRQTLLTFSANPASGSIHEAAIVVGLLRDIVTPVGGLKSTFREAEMPSRQNSEGRESTSVIETTPSKFDPSAIFESRCREKGIDCVSALATNPHLKTYAVYSMALEASRIDGNSPMFVQNLTSSIKTELQYWGDLAKKMGLDVQPVNTAVTSPTQSPTDTQPAPPVATPDDNSAANLNLIKAMEFAGKEDFEKAILEARKVKAGTEPYQSAQENLKNWANKAVQELRRQAANQYRSSSTTSDPKGKKSHLEKAKNFLDQAIEKYPEASTLDTVKENLEIIHNELGRIK